MKRNVLYSRGGTDFAALLVGVILAGFAAGLIALWWVKSQITHQLDDQISRFEIATNIAFLSTFAIFVGSISGLVIAELVGSTTAICDLADISGSGDCPRSNFWMSTAEFMHQYVGPLLVYFAMPFFMKTWLSLIIGMYHDYFFNIIKNKSFSPKNQTFEHRHLSHVLLFSLFFSLFSIASNIHKSGYEWCQYGHSSCYLFSGEHFSIYNISIYTIKTLFEPWSHLPFIISASLGNQFRIDELYPLIMLTYALFNWRKNNERQS